MVPKFVISIAVLVLGLVPPRASAGTQVPPGFSIARVAGAPEVHFPMFATLDGGGGLFVAESSGLDLYEELQKQTRRCRVTHLENRNGGGVYEQARVFADHLVFPMGLAWRDGKLYVADPPDVVTLEDTDGDGRADKRTVILTGFGHTDNGSLHGLTFGPDGWLYLTLGQPDGYRLQKPDGSVLTGKSGALFRCRHDGTDVEVVCRGFENLVEIEFMPAGEIIGTDNWFSLPEGGQRDALVHLTPGGLYPLQVRDQGTVFFRGAKPLPPVQMYPAVALSGMVRYRGSLFPEPYRDRLFTAQFNTRKVVSHRLTRDGSTFRAKDEDFLTTDDPDFHPSDVLEDTDGSLLVVDTGAWYVQHCPTGRIRQAPAEGGVYRVRFGGAGKPINQGAPSRRDDLAGADALAAEARSWGRASDASAEPQLRGLLARPEMHLRLAAAEALSTCGSAASVPTLLEALAGPTDFFLEYALTHTLHRLADSAAMATMLANPNVKFQKAALVLLDQPSRQILRASDVVPRLSSGDESLRETARNILFRHAEWGAEVRPLLESLFAETTLTVENTGLLTGLVQAFYSNDSIEPLLATCLVNTSVPIDTRLLTLDAMSKVRIDTWPPSWTSAFRDLLEKGLEPLRLQTARLASQRKIEVLREPLLALIEQKSAQPELRLEAIRATLGQRPRLTPAGFDLLLDRMNSSSPGALRLGAAELLGRAQWTNPENDPERLVSLLSGDRVVPVSTLLPIFLQATNTGWTAAWNFLREHLRGGWQPSPRDLELIRQKMPKASRAEFEQAASDAAKRIEDQRGEIDSRLDLLAGGDRGRGQIIFAEKAACATCHRVGAQGGLVAPDLTTIGAIRSGRDLLESVLFPSASFAQGYETYNVSLRNGEDVTGVRVRQGEDDFVLRDAGGSETRLRPAQIQSVNRLQLSLMPEGLLNGLTRDEARDLFAYLQSLR